MSRSVHSTSPDSEISNFPVLTRAFDKYFPNRAQDLIDRYYAVGESSFEFKGLLAEVEFGANAPTEAASFLNQKLHLDLTSEQAQEHLIDLHDQLTRSGIYGEQHAAEEKARIKAEKPSTDELMAYYLKRRVQLRSPFTKLSAPIWVYPVVSIVVIGLAAALMAVVPDGSAISGVLNSVLVLVMGVATIVLFAAVVVMNGLRAERVDPEKERARTASFEKSRAEKAAKPRRSIVDRLNPFS